MMSIAFSWRSSVLRRLLWHLTAATNTATTTAMNAMTPIEILTISPLFNFSGGIDVKMLEQEKNCDEDENRSNISKFAYVEK